MRHERLPVSPPKAEHKEHHLPYEREPKFKEYNSQIVLNFFRHGEKEKKPPEGLSGDAEVRLTPAGRKGAMKAGQLLQEMHGDVAGIVVKGSPRKRTQETGLFAMSYADSSGTITGDEELEELLAKVNKGKKYGSKIGVDRRLDFHTGSKSYETEMMKAAMNGYLMRWMVDDSDELAVRLGETEGSTYSREAAGIATIILNYLDASGSWDERVTKQRKDKKTLQRALATHQSVGESFVAKVIEKTKGKKDRDMFLEAIEENGFGFVEGFTVRILYVPTSKSPVVKIEYIHTDTNGKSTYTFDHTLSYPLLLQIIEDAEVLNERVALQTKKS